jgi:homogentisate 1,2-dioxygenase
MNATDIGLEGTASLQPQTRTGLPYLTGFSNHFSTEAVLGALPLGRNSPQQSPMGLYTEQFSGTAFTVPRAEARRTWLYRVNPSAAHAAFRPVARGDLCGPLAEANPNRLRWDALPALGTRTDFLAGLFTLGGTTDPETAQGATIHLYRANCSMRRAFYNADGELLIVPSEGALRIATECGLLDVAPGEIAVIPRGLKFRVELLDSSARGYVAENHGSALRLPELGPIGSNGLANPRDFRTPVAWFERCREGVELVQKFHGSLWSTFLSHSPFDVVAWHGNNVPYVYDLARFNAINSVSFDHPDPSIFTVLTSPTPVPGVANLDFVVFPPRWMVAEDTFRPPWFHRNAMTECMGLICGRYDAKAAGFVPGGVSLHPCMSAHGPDAATAERARQVELKPERIEGSIAFMFETSASLRPSLAALASTALQPDYDDCWTGLPTYFDVRADA